MSAELNWVEWLFGPWAAPTPKEVATACRRQVVSELRAINLAAASPSGCARAALIANRCRACRGCNFAPR